MISLFEKKKEEDLFKRFLFLKQAGGNEKIDDIIANIDGCSSKELNFLVESLLKKMGYETQVIDGFNDKGIDIMCFKNGAKKLAVQCKAWHIRRSMQPVNIKDVKAFKSSMNDNDFPKGIFVTTHYFTDPAFKEENSSLILIDRKKLVSLLARFFPKSVANSYYYETIKDFASCQHCKDGKIIKLYSEDKRRYYGRCETCGEFGKFK